MAADERDSARVGGEQLGRSSMEAFQAIAENSLDLILRFDRKFPARLPQPRGRAPDAPAAARNPRQDPTRARDARRRRRLWEEALERVFRSGQPRRFEFALGASWVDAQEHFEAFASAETGAHGEVETVLVVVRDVSERVRAGQGAGCAHGGAGARAADRRMRQLPLGCGHRRARGLRGAAAALALRQRRAGDARRAGRGRARRRSRPRGPHARRGQPTRGVRGRCSSACSIATVSSASCARAARSSLAGRARVSTARRSTSPTQEDVQSTVRQLLRFSQFAIDHIDDAVVWIDAGGRILSANRAASERFGERAEALVGQPIGRLGLQQPSESWTERWQRAEACRARALRGGSSWRHAGRGQRAPRVAAWAGVRLHGCRARATSGGGVGASARRAGARSAHAHRRERARAGASRRDAARRSREWR